MIRTVGILIIIYLSIFSCTKENSDVTRKNDTSKYGLNGRVKFVKSEVYKLIPEKDTFKIGKKVNGISIDRNSLKKFNQYGNLTSSKEFLANGKISHEIIYKYDENNRLFKKKEIDNYGTDSFYEFKYTYNSEDSIIQTVISNDNFKRIYKIERDEKNRLIKNEVTQNDTTFTSYIVKYDQNNNIIFEKEFKNKGIPFKIIEGTFNQNNLKVKEKVVEYNSWDTLTYENKFFYGKNQHLILIKYHIQNDSNYIEIKNTYYKNGELKKSITTPKGSKYFVVSIREFNENGELIKYLRLPNNDNTKKVWDYKFKYDSKNNWIKKLEFKDKKPLRIVKRTIEYY